MTNVDSILKSRDTTLLTKVNLVKTMVFPVVMYGCEIWTINKAKRRRIDAFECGERWLFHRNSPCIYKDFQISILFLYKQFKQVF